MADERSTAVRRRAGLPAVRPPVAATMTPKEILGVLRRHLVLMVLLTIVGLVVSGVGCGALRPYLPKYTALTYIQVLSPVDEDPMGFDRPYLHQDILYGHRLNIASLIKQQGNLEALLRKDAITGTNWFKDTPGLARRVKSLEKNLGAYAHRDADYIEVSMRCADAKSCGRPNRPSKTFAKPGSSAISISQPATTSRTLLLLNWTSWSLIKAISSLQSGSLRPT